MTDQDESSHLLSHDPNQPLQTPVATQADYGGIGNSCDLNAPSQPVFKTYKRRWYILFMFSMLNGMQGYLNNIWPVISQSAEKAFGWRDSTITMLMNWLYITYLVAMFPCAYLINKRLRCAVLLCALLIVAGAICRCITDQDPDVTWLAHTGNIMTGFAGPVALSGGATVSALWFPPNQRATATAIGSIAGFAGASLCYVIGPQMVDAPPNMVQDGLSLKASAAKQFVREHTPISTDEEFDYDDPVAMKIRHQILVLRYIECGVCGLLFVALLIYFPSKPPLPPSVSGAMSRERDTWQEIKQLFTKDNATFWCAAIPSGMSAGIFGIWAPLLALNLQKVGVHEATAGWMGFYASMAGCFVGVLFSRLADVLQGIMKLLILVLVAWSILCMYIFTLIADQYIPFSLAGLYAACIGTGMAVNGCIPLYFELCIEAVYPVPESITTGMITVIYNIFPIIFLGVSIIPRIGHSWMNWCMFATMLLCFPLMLTFKERYRRLELDKQAALESQSNDPVINT